MFNIITGKELFYSFGVGMIKYPFNKTFFFFVRNDRSIGTFAQDEAQGANKYTFTGARLTGDDIEPLAEFNFNYCE